MKKNDVTKKKSSMIFIFFFFLISIAVPDLKSQIKRSFIITGNNREVVDFEVSNTGLITAEVTWRGTIGRLSVILNGPKQTGYYVRQDGTSPLKITYNVSSSDLALGKNWKISIVSFQSTGSVTGTVEILYPELKTTLPESDATMLSYASAEIPYKKQYISQKGLQVRNNEKITKQPQKIPDYSSEFVAMPIKKAIIPFTPIQIIDPLSGNSIDPNTTFVIPRQGDNPITISAADYYKELNRLEKEFNAIGYSLDVRKIPQTTVEIPMNRRLENTLINDKRSLQSKYKTTMQGIGVDKIMIEHNKYLGSRAVLARLPQSKAPTMPKYNVPIREQFDYDKVESPTIYEYTNTTGKLDLGERDLFAISRASSSQYEGEIDRVKITTHAEAGVTIFGEDIKLLSMDGETSAINSKDNTQYKTNLTTSMLGYVRNVFSPITSTSNISNISGNYEKDEETGFSADFPIGPLNISVDVGVRGYVGVDYDTIFASPRNVGSTYSPYVGAELYAQAGIDLFIVEAGAYCELTLMDDRMTIKSSLAVTEENYEGSTLIYDNIKALSGNVGLYACIIVPAFNLPPWTHKCWHWDIISWNGFGGKGYIGDEPTFFSRPLYGETQIVKESMGYDPQETSGLKWNPNDDLTIVTVMKEQSFVPVQVSFNDRIYQFFINSNRKLTYMNIDPDIYEQYKSFSSSAKEVGDQKYLWNYEIPYSNPIIIQDNTNVSNISPEVSVYEDRLYVFYTSTRRGTNYIAYKFMDRNGRWFPLQGNYMVPSLTDKKPALAVFRDRLYIIYTHPSDYRIYYRSADIKNNILSWDIEKVIPGSTTTATAPAACVFKDMDGYEHLLVFHKGKDNNEIYYRDLHQLAGENWSPNNNDQKVGYCGTSHSPAVTVFDKNLYLVYKGKDNNIFYKVMDEYFHWCSEEKIAEIVMTNAAPSVYAIDRRLFMFYRSSGDFILTRWYYKSSPDEVELYEHDNYKGKVNKFKIGNWNQTNFREKFGVSSIRIPKGWSVVVYANDSFQGQSQTFRNNIVTLSGTTIGNDKIKSIRVMQDK